VGIGSCSGQILIFTRIATRVSLYQDRPERNSKLSVSEDHLSQARGEKPEHLPEITSIRSEEKVRVPPRDHFGLSHSSKCRTLTKALCGRGSRSLQRRSTKKSSTTTIEDSSTVGFCDLWSQSHCQSTSMF